MRVSKNRAGRIHVNHLLVMPALENQMELNRESGMATGLHTVTFLLQGSTLKLRDYDRPRYGRAHVISQGMS